MQEYLEQGNRSAGLEVLLAEDDRDIAATVAEILRKRGHNVTVTGDGDRAATWLAERAFDLLLTDIRLPGTDGLALFRQAREARPETSVILMSAFGSISEAVEAVKNDATYYLSKPFSVGDLELALGEVEARAALRAARAAVSCVHGDPMARIVGETPAMVALRDFVRNVAASDGPVLITGETGTGKELIAETIHALSPRTGAFVPLNCAAFPDTLLEAELFGHERGAFTGASHKRAGRFRVADGGTLFLDEIAEMSAGAQAKLLRVLENGSVQPLGSDVSQQVDVRIVSATNADLRGPRAAPFRDDLFYRIKMFHVHVPPLRERPADLPLLVASLLRACRPDGRIHVTPRAWAALCQYEYPGNVRELRSVIGHAAALCGDDDIEVRHLPAELRGGEGLPNSDSANGLQPLAVAERAFQRGYLLRVMEATEWNKTRAAELLGISRKTLWRKLRDLGVE